ncbi:MAG: Gfo/Idh/MocA family oxidoreductase [Elusimicrobia bacterium]|nr:Gfo/Idh/MocA family oxidoreductase [Elusimicrobiota bacterium]MBK9922211.1 Gfo/Idh/MocA family oxidoreductase [Elusimicrobiota bacterium]
MNGATENRTPSVAVIGCGYWGQNLVRNFHALGALRAVAEADADRRAQFAPQYSGVAFVADVGDALADPAVTAVAVATPAETHAAVVRRALEAGKDVFVEKPLALTEEDGRALVALAREKKRVLMVGHLLWYHPAVARLKELVAQGELGKIQYIYSHRLNLGKIRREENILWSFAPHDVSVILGLLGEMPTEVRSQGGSYLQEKIADVTVSLLSFPSGVKAHIFVSWLHPFKEQKLVVVGSRKMAVFDDLEKTDKLRLYPHRIDWKDGAPVVNKAEAEPVALPAEEPLRAECAHFLERLADRRAPRTDGEEGLRVLSVLRRCQDSLSADRQRRGGPVREGVHESAFIDEDVVIGPGTQIWHVSHVLKGSRIGAKCKIGQNVVIGPRVTVGDGVKIQNNVSVYEGVTLEDNVFCGPSMVFTNVFNPRSEINRMGEIRPTVVKRGATLGANCTIVCGVTIGEYAFVGAGAVVTKDVPPFALVVGNPARPTGWMCRCGTKRGPKQNAPCPACGAAWDAPVSTGTRKAGTTRRGRNR